MEGQRAVEWKLYGGWNELDRGSSICFGFRKEQRGNDWGWRSPCTRAAELPIYTILRNVGSWWDRLDHGEPACTGSLAKRYIAWFVSPVTRVGGAFNIGYYYGHGVTTIAVSEQSGKRLILYSFVIDAGDTYAGTDSVFCNE